MAKWQCRVKSSPSRHLLWPEFRFVVRRLRIRLCRAYGLLRRVLAKYVRLLFGYRRPGLVDEAPLEHAVVRVVDGEPLGVAERRLTGNGPVWRVRPALLAPLWRRRPVTDLSRALPAASALAEVLLRASRLSRCCVLTEDLPSVGIVVAPL